MIKIENSIVIRAERDKCFSVVSDFEAWPEFIPAYKEVKIIERKGNKMVIERKGSVGRKEVLWRSEAELFPPDLIKSRQVVGPIPDMEITWQFSEDYGKTKIVLIHNFRYRKIPLIGGIIGRLIVAKVVRGMAQETLEAIKRRIEVTF